MTTTEPPDQKPRIPSIVSPSLLVPSRKRNRCISCSDSVVGSSFEDNSPYLIPELVSRRTRTCSISARIHEDVRTGVVKYFCRSRGHGFIVADQLSKEDKDESPAEEENNHEVHNKTKESSNNEEIFMHISDINSEFVPRPGDKVCYRLCPIPPKFEKVQAVNVEILELSDNGSHKRWDNPETQEELKEDNDLDNHSPIYDV